MKSHREHRVHRGFQMTGPLTVVPVLKFSVISVSSVAKKVSPVAVFDCVICG